MYLLRRPRSWLCECGGTVHYVANVTIKTFSHTDIIQPFFENEHKSCNWHTAVTLVLICIVGFQTGGFTRDEPKPFITWPKVRRKKKVVHRRIIIDADGNETVEEVPAGQATAAAAPRRSRRTRKED